MTPAELILSKLNMEPVEFAHRMGANRTLWHQWMKRDGKIPTSAYGKILKIAKKEGIEITLEDMFYGR